MRRRVLGVFEVLGRDGGKDSSGVVGAPNRDPAIVVAGVTVELG